MKRPVVRTPLRRRRTAITAAAIAAAGIIFASCDPGNGQTDPADRPGSDISTEDGRIDIGNAPEQLDATGTTATLTHQSGLSLTAPIVDGTLRPPVLWDGDWTLESDGGTVLAITVGDTEPSKDLRTCIENDAVGSTDAIRCAQALMTRVGLEDGYAAGHALLTAAGEASRDDMRWGKYCHLSAMTLAAASVLGGENPRHIMDDFEPLCEYSTFHGAGAAVVLMNPDNVVAAVTEACTPNPLAERVEFSQGTQCWHGAGIGLSYLHRFEPLLGLSVCQQAPQPEWGGNCIEGMFGAYREYLKRLEPGQWVTSTGTVESCHNLYQQSESVYLADTCYRDVAQRLYFRHSASPETFAETLSAEISLFETACTNGLDDEERLACWNGMALQIAAGVLMSVGEDRIAAAQRITACDDGGDLAGACYQRMALAMYRHPQRPTGLPVEEVLALIPQQHRVGVEEAIANWLEKNYGTSI